MKKTRHLIALVGALVCFIVLICPFISHAADDTDIYNITTNVNPNQGRAPLRPNRWSRKLAAGTITTPPRLRPDMAMLMARPLFRMNQLAIMVLMGTTPAQLCPTPSTV